MPARRQRLVLSGRRYFASHRKIIEKRPGLLGGHIPGVALVMEENVAADPVQILRLGAIAVALQPQALADSVEESGRLRRQHA
jgi:hypothetical protein